MGVLELLDQGEHAGVGRKGIPSLGKGARNVSFGYTELAADLLVAFVLLERSSTFVLVPCWGGEDGSEGRLGDRGDVARPIEQDIAEVEDDTGDWEFHGGSG